MKAWIGETLPRSTKAVGAYIAQEFGVVYESRSGLIAMLHRLGLEYVKPEAIGRKLDPEKQKAFIQAYENLLNSLDPDEGVMFLDAIHPTHAARPVGCWAPAKDHLAIEQTSGRQRLNVHGAIDLETGKTAMIDVETVDAASTMSLLETIEEMYPLLAVIHVFLDNARYHHAQAVERWLAQPGRRIRLHFIPAYCPHLNPIERLWGVMHKHLTHNTCYASHREFAETVLTFLGACPDSIQRDGAVKGMSGSGPGIGGFGWLGRVGGVQAVARSAIDRLRPWASLSMLWARQTRPHSWATLSSPRIRN